MKLIKVEYTGKTSQGIYANVTYTNFWGKLKTREAFLKMWSEDYYSRIPQWVDNFKNVGGFASYEAVQKEMIRQYELNK